MAALGRRRANAALHPTSARRRVGCVGWHALRRVRAGERPCRAAFASDSGAPISFDTVEASSGIFFWYAAMIFSSNATRSATVVFENVVNAFFAAATARFTSSWSPRTIVPITSSFAGFRTSSVCLLWGSTHLPSI